jgi:hypothetical protein
MAAMSRRAAGMDIRFKSNTSAMAMSGAISIPISIAIWIQTRKKPGAALAPTGVERGFVSLT